MLRITGVGSSAYVRASNRSSQSHGATTRVCKLVSSSSALFAEQSDNISLTEQAHNSAVPGLKSDSSNNTFSRYLFGISIASLWTAYGILNITEREELRIPVLLDRDYVPQLPVEIVLSMYKEPIDEVYMLFNHLQSMQALSDADITIYIKDIGANNTYAKQQTEAHTATTLPKIRREGETFLNHILKRGHDLARQKLFLQAGIHNPRELHTHIRNYYDRDLTGFINLGWPGRLWDCENCSDRFGWQDDLHSILQVCKQIYNSAICQQVLLR